MSRSAKVSATVLVRAGSCWDSVGLIHAQIWAILARFRRLKKSDSDLRLQYFTLLLLNLLNLPIPRLTNIGTRNDKCRWRVWPRSGWATQDSKTGAHDLRVWALSMRDLERGNCRRVSDPKSLRSV